jgi:hypothetical protein
MNCLAAREVMDLYIIAKRSRKEEAGRAVLGTWEPVEEKSFYVCSGTGQEVNVCLMAFGLPMALGSV